MMSRIPRTLLLTFNALAVVSIAAAVPQTATVASPSPAISEGFKMGDARSPDGQTLTLDSRSLLLNGKPWTPVMGEFHYSRVPEEEEREGLDITSHGESAYRM